ncbi:SMI1/KNR4 family protein [Actinokineospora guangxiensis]|uniref:SMI1/KNR4 family protein n=1 Tax=Actinokineospora guangxiensis TaxID=1490288 RepID=A0ABW0EGC9_9PSEU
MEITEDRTFPAALAALTRVDFPYDDEELGSIDYEAYQEFDSAEDTTGWLRSWTGNDGLDGAAFRVFGQDGTGGLAAIWLVRPGRPLAEQPVVFFGSEGETGVVAASLGEYLWLLADGVGPMEAVAFGTSLGVPHAGLRAVAEEHSGIPPRSADAVVEAARAGFPDFSATVESWCR